MVATNVLSTRWPCHLQRSDKQQAVCGRTSPRGNARMVVVRPIGQASGVMPLAPERRR
jgi:hypothetical protein